MQGATSEGLDRTMSTNTAEHSLQRPARDFAHAAKVGASVGFLLAFLTVLSFLVEAAITGNLTRHYLTLIASEASFIIIVLVVFGAIFGAIVQLVRRISGRAFFPLVAIGMVASIAYAVYYANTGWTPARIEQAIKSDLPSGSTRQQVESWADAHRFTHLWGEPGLIRFTPPPGVDVVEYNASRIAELKRQNVQVLIALVLERDADVPGRPGLLRGDGEIQINFYFKDGKLDRYELDLDPPHI